MEKTSKWRSIFRDVKAYVSRSSEKKDFSQEDEPILENTAGDLALAANDKNDDFDTFVNNDAEERQLAEAFNASRTTPSHSVARFLIRPSSL